MVVGVLTVLLVVLAVVLREKIDHSLLGLALVNMMGVGWSMKTVIQQWSVLETSLGAVTRVRDFSRNTPSEVLPKEKTVPAEMWPARGDIDIRNLVVQYE